MGYRKNLTSLTRKISKMGNSKWIAGTGFSGNSQLPVIISSAQL
jgi:hypothetical protein